MENINIFIKDNVSNLGKKVFIAPDIPEKKMNNVIKAFKCEDFYKSILAVFDNTLFGACDEGLIFTGEKMILKKMFSDPIIFLYKDIESVDYIKNVTVNNKGKEEIESYTEILTFNGTKYKINSLNNFNYEVFTKMLTDLTKHSHFKEENQLKTISEMSEELKIAYLKIIINMTFIDDEKIDEKELTELFLLMTRLELDIESRFSVRAYITEISKENIISVENLLKVVKENSESYYKSIMISLVKDMINVYFSTKNTIDKNFDFLENNKELFKLSEDEIDLVYSTVKNDHKIIEEDLDDNVIKKNLKELASKATALGTPLAAVYISGSVIGMSAAGMTSGLATLGMGGILGFSSMATGIGVTILIGIGTYQGMKYLTGANELDKYKTKELLLHEVIKQTQKTISLIIDDINYIVQKLNDTILNHAEESEKIKKLSNMVVQFQAALKNVDSKTNQCQNSINRLQCPKVLDKTRLKSLTNEPIKKPLYDFIIKNYEESDSTLKENLQTEILEKMVKFFEALGYFDMDNILKGKASEGFDKLKKGIFR